MGQKCKYNGGDNYSEKVIDYVKGHEVIPVCPELGLMEDPSGQEFCIRKEIFWNRWEER